MSVSGAGVDHGIGCSELPEYCSDAKDSFTETMMNLNALNGEGDHITSSSAISDGSHGSFKNDRVSGTKEKSTDDIIHDIDLELSENNLPDSKDLNKHVIIISSPDEKPNSHFVKENSVNGELKNACQKDTKEMSTGDVYRNFDKLTTLSKDSGNSDTYMEVAGSEEASTRNKNSDQLTVSLKAESESANVDCSMEMDSTTDCVEQFSHVNQGSAIQNVNISSDELNTVNHSGQSSINICTDASCDNSISCSKDSNSCVNSVEHNSVSTSSTNLEPDKSVSGTGLDINQASPVSDKTKTKHLCDNIPLNPLAIHDKVRNSIRNIMYKVKHSKTTELTKTCLKTKSLNTASPEKTCDMASPGKTCDTTFRAEGKLSFRKDNLFESITEFSVKPKLDQRKLDSPENVDPDQMAEEQNTYTEYEADRLETNQNIELHLELEESYESGPKTDTSDLIEDDSADKTEASREVKEEGESAMTSDTSSDSESQPTTTKCERIFNANNFESLPNSAKSDRCLVDDHEVDKSVALVDDSDASGSPLSPASVSDTRQTPSSSEVSQSTSSEDKSNLEKMETSDISTDNNDIDLKQTSDDVQKPLVDDVDIKPPDLISDDLKENDKDCDSSEVEVEEKSKLEEESSVKSKEDESAEKAADLDTQMSSVGGDDTTDRKRCHEDKLDCEQPPKRSRLDEVIGKLGSVIGISPETVEQVDSDSDSEESRHSESSGGKSEAEDITSVSDDDDDKTSQATSQSSTKTVRLSSKELEALVRSKVQSYMSAHRDEQIAQLQKKVTDLQEANDRWKTQASDLQKMIVDLTVLKQKLEKRKAATAALRKITTKTIGIQVALDEQKLAAVSQRLAKTPPKSTAPLVYSTAASQSVTPSHSSTSSVVSATKPSTPTMTLTSCSVAARNSVTQLLSATAMPRVSTAVTTMNTPPIPSSIGVRPQLTQHLNNAASTVRSLLDNARVGETIRLQGVPNSVGSSLLVVSPITPSSTQGSVAAVPKVIDLTADDDGQPKAGQVVQTVQVLPAGANTSQLRPTSLHQLPQQVIRQMGPQGIPGTSILLSSPAGTQILNNSASLNRPGSTFQVVTIASGSNIRPGTLLTMVPATSTQLSSVRPQGVSTAKQITPQSMPQLRAGQPTQLTYTTTSVRPSPPAQSMRPPPPLMSAPPPQTQTVVRVSVPPTSSSIPSSAAAPALRHPAPLPATPVSKVVSGKPLPPKPSLKISRVSQGIVLSWNVANTENVSEISSYQLFAYQETSAPASTSLWKKVGDVKALPLPMACTLTQFQDGNKYHFAVRAIDQSGRFGDFSDPSTIHLISKP